MFLTAVMISILLLMAEGEEEWRGNTAEGEGGWRFVSDGYSDFNVGRVKELKTWDVLRRNSISWWEKTRVSLTVFAFGKAVVESRNPRERRD